MNKKINVLINFRFFLIFFTNFIIKSIIIDIINIIPERCTQIIWILLTDFIISQYLVMALRYVFL